MRQLEETLHLLAGQDPVVDTAELIDRIEQGLSEEGVPVVARDGSSIMQTREITKPTTATTPPKRSLVLAAAVLAVVLAIAIPAWFLGDGTDVALSPSDPVFIWGDDITGWITNDEMEEMLEYLSERYAGAELGEGELEYHRYDKSTHPDEYDWVYDPVAPGDPTWQVFMTSDPQFEDYVGPQQTDPRLPEGVVFVEDWGPGYVLKGPNSDEAVSIGLIPPRELMPYESFPERREPYDEMFFDFASTILRELGWAD